MGRSDTSSTPYGLAAGQRMCFGSQAAGHWSLLVDGVYEKIVKKKELYNILTAL